MSFQLGDGELHPGKYNMTLVRRAIKNGWPVPAELKAKIMTQMEKIVEHSEDERNQIAAAKVVVAADSVNARREATEVEAEKPGQVTNELHLHVQPETLTHDELLRRHKEALSIPAIHPES